jgi:hypothetical protein
VDFLHVETVFLHRSSAMGGGVPQIGQVLDRHGIALLRSQLLSLPLDAHLRVETIFTDPPYSVFDAWFHGMD